MTTGRRAVVTGASSGIGEASARAPATAGYEVVLGARRTERIKRVAEEIAGQAITVDVADAGSVNAFCASIVACDVVVCCAGGALGLETVEESADADLASDV